MFFHDLPYVPDLLVQEVQGTLSTRLRQNLACLSCRPLSSDIRTLAHSIRHQFETIIILGTGGSSLGGQVLCALSHDQQAPRIVFLDEIHPDFFYRTVLAHDPEKTAVIVISKSGTTAETLCQLLAIFEHFLSPHASKHFFVLTEEGNSPLRTLADTYGFSCVTVPSDIGGRFSVLSPTGLFPALIAGINEAALLKGSCQMLENTRRQDPLCVKSLAVAVQWTYSKINSVFLSYDTQFTPLSLWYRQLWAESLGKNGIGTTPITSQGTIDQHSQLQLYLDGPKDKAFTFLSVSKRDSRVLFDATTVDVRLNYLNGKTMEELLTAECQATYDALQKQAIPVRHFAFPIFDETYVGALLAYLMIEVIVTADILRVNPFDQPAVERIKSRTREILS
ncbi:MAG: hypothetical protein LBH38_02040 [Holosporales bacterium]|jgi:glucose-6-phosphate isomerase|nr:hypothetical protein [Holosporales bacterium]